MQVYGKKLSLRSWAGQAFDLITVSEPDTDMPFDFSIFLC